MLDVLQPPEEVDEKYYVKQEALEGLILHAKKQKSNGRGFGAVVQSVREKSNTVTTRNVTGGMHYIDISDTVSGRIDDLKQIGHFNKGKQGDRIYDPSGKSCTITSDGGGMGRKTGLYRVDNIDYSQGKIIDDTDDADNASDKHTGPELLGTIGEYGQGRRVFDGTEKSATLTAGDSKRQDKYAIPILTPNRKVKHQNGRRCKEKDDKSFTLTCHEQHGVIQLADGDKPIYENGMVVGYVDSDGDEHSLYSLNDRVDGHAIRRLTPLECERLQGFPQIQHGISLQVKDTSWSIAYKNRFVYIGTSTKPQIQSTHETLPAHETFSETIKSMPAHETFSETIKSMPAHETFSETIKSMPAHETFSETIKSMPAHETFSETRKSMPAHKTPTPETLPDPAQNDSDTPPDPAQNNSTTPQTLSSSQSDRAPHHDIHIVYGGAILNLYRDEKLLLSYNTLKRHGKSPPVPHDGTTRDTKVGGKSPHTDCIVPPDTILPDTILPAIISSDVTLRDTVSHFDTIRKYLHHTRAPFVQGTVVVQSTTMVKKSATKSKTNTHPGKEQFNNAVNGIIDFIRSTIGLTDFSLYIDIAAGYTADQPDGARYKQIGNAVCVPVIEQILDQMEKHVFVK